MKINGQQYDFETMSVSAVLNALSLAPMEVVVEVDGEIVPQEHFPNYLVDKGAIVEIVAFVGGG